MRGLAFIGYGASVEPDLEGLLRAARDKQPGAWDQLAPALDKGLARFFRRMVGDADAEELTQTTMLTIVQEIPGFVPRKTLSAWVFGIARNVANHRLRKRYSEESFQALLAQVDPTTKTSPLSRLYQKDLFALLREEIERMPPHYRRAVEIELDGRGIKTHARLENISFATAGVRRHRAHNWLRKRLEARRKALSVSPASPAPG